MTEHLQKDQRLDQILDAAGKLFGSKGFDKTSVDEIAREAGLSKGAIYWYFPSKEQILISLAERFTHQSQDTVIQLASEEELGPEAIFLAHRYLYQQKAADPLPDLLFQQFVSISAKYPEVADALDRNHQNWVNVISELLERGIREGNFKSFDTQIISEAISALYRGTCTTKYENPERAYQIVEYTCKLIYEAIVTDERRRQVAAGAEA